MVAHILSFRYDAQMKWAVAGVYPNEAKAANARQRLTKVMQRGTEFMIAPVKVERPDRKERRDRDNDEE
jgi:hypothetical protein